MNTLIVEDELIIATDLQHMLKQFGFSEPEIAISYTEAIEILKEKDIHLAILDINLGGYKTGIDVAEYIRQHINIPYIFLSSYEDIPTVNAALATRPNAYLQKPFQKTSLYAAIELALKDFRKAPSSEQETDANLVIRDALFIKEKHLYTRIQIADIQFIKSDGNYLELHETGKKHLIREALKSMQEQLPAEFLKVHKSYLVNVKKITSFTNTSVSIGGTEIPIAANYRDELLGRIRTFS
jgi:DNA-binding LytR/AlgR family response regulator